MADKPVADTPATTPDRSRHGEVHGWDGGLQGHVTCSCGFKTRFFAYANAHDVTCRGCHTVYRVTWVSPTITRVP